MRQAVTALVLLLVVSACSGDGSTTETSVDAGPTTTVVVSCPSGILSSIGDGPDYLVVRNAFERAENNAISDTRPLYLGTATAAIPQDLMVGLRYTGCASLDGPVIYEQMAWSNGIGLLLVSWQEWPRTEDPSNTPFGGEATQRGIVQVSRLEQGTESTRVRVVHLFDGLKVVTAYSFALTTMSIDQVEDVAWVVYDGLPIDMQGAESTGAGIQDALDAVRSDAITVSDPEPSNAMSAFTAILGAAHTTYTAVIDGSGVTLYDFGTREVAERMVGTISHDGFSIAHLPYPWAADPHFWIVGRVIVQYEGTRADLIGLLDAGLGTAVAGAVAPTP